MPLRRKIVLEAYKLFDLVNLCFCLFLATSEVYYPLKIFNISQILELEAKVQHIILFIAILLTWRTVFSACGLYGSKRLSKRTKEYFGIIGAVSVGTLLISIETSLFGIGPVTYHFIAVFWTFSCLSTILSRIVLRYALGLIRIRGRNLRFLLIVGTNQRAIQFAKEIEESPKLGYRFIGFVDETLAGTNNLQNTNFAFTCNFDEFPNYIRDNVVDEVAIALPLKTFYDQALRIARLCAEQGIGVRYPSNIFNVEHAHLTNGNLKKNMTTEFRLGSLDDKNVLIKRMLDLSVSLILLFLFSPLFIAAALAIKVTSSGPVFFVQKRVGLNKRIFRFYKFRSMVPDAEQRQAEVEHLNEASGPVFKIEHDPRITRIGRILRKTSLDELPQLINVLKGDMSLVGPRPLPIRDYKGFDEDWHRRRLSVKPGITCLWQVNGRSTISFEKWMELDMKYIDQWSLWLDIKILAKTIPAALRGAGAA